MTALRQAWARVVSFFRKQELDHDFDEELASHIELATEEHLRQGMSLPKARRQALIKLGGIEPSKEAHRDTRGLPWLDGVLQDLRYAVRMMRRSPGFTAVAVLSLALGIGANTAIYSVMNAVMFRPLPVKSPGDLVILSWRAKQGPENSSPEPPGIKIVDGNVYTEPGGARVSSDFPWPFFQLLSKQNDSFAELYAYKDAGQLNLAVGGAAELGRVEFVSGNFFKGLGIDAAAGPLIVESDNVPATSAVAVLDYRYWWDRFGGSADAIGQTVRISEVPFTIIGVAEPKFYGVAAGSAPVIYVPLTSRQPVARNTGSLDEELTGGMFTDPKYYWADIIGRLRPGATMASAEVEIANRFRQYVLGSVSESEAASQRDYFPVLWLEEGASGSGSLRRQYAKPLFVLMMMAACILAIACANVASLLLARGAGRRREIALRLSLGASRIRVLQQLLTESVLLALMGAIVGGGVAAIGSRFLLWLLAAGRDDFQIRTVLDWRILLFTIVIAVVSGIFFGFAPALESTRADITPSIKGTGAAARRGRKHRAGSYVLVVAQIARSLLLVLGAALFVRTLLNLRSVQLGFNAENVLTFNLNASKAGYKGSALIAFYAQMEDRLATLPGVRAATVTGAPLAADSSFRTPVTYSGNKKGSGSWCAVGPTFFQAMQIPILRGRAIDTRDVENSPLVVVVNQAFADKYFPNANPVGEHIKIVDGTDVTIVGVAKNIRDSLKQEVSPFVYIAYRQNYLIAAWRGMYFEVRTASDPVSLAQTIRKTVYETAPNVPVAGLMTQMQRIDNSIGQERTFAYLCTAFAVLALAIACVGLYGSMAHSVSYRTNEIGIRMALGAEPGRIQRMVLRETLLLTAAGVAIGVPTALFLSRFAQGFLYGLEPHDPSTIAVAVMALAVSGGIAGYLPARRAAQVDPITALRHD